MKIAIATNFDMTNYGSVLQAFALQRRLAELGADSYVLRSNLFPKRTVPQRVRTLFKKSDVHYSVKDKLRIRMAKKTFAPKRRRMAAFCAAHITSRSYYGTANASLAVGDADAVIAGSDQVWSPYMLRSSQMFYSLGFVPERIPRYAYAASIGVDALPGDCADRLRAELPRFGGISLRERSSVGLIQALTDKPVRVDCDPTLLYDRTLWDDLASDRAAGQDYIFVYMLRPEPVAIGLARQLREKTGLKIILCSNRPVREDGIENITDAGIEDFLSYFKYARYVVTNSFHGTAFAVQFETRFLSVVVEGTGRRARDFLTDLGLEDRIAQEGEADNIDRPVDWQAVAAKRASLRAASVNYLRDIVSAVPASEEREEIVLFRDGTECCGCGACANACPHDAITMEPDDCGFVFPRIDQSRCVRCGLCRRVCAYRNGLPEVETVRALGAVAKSDDIRRASASGGVFAAVAQEFLKKGGVVCGCGMQNRGGRLTPAHVCIESADDLPLLQSSKYSQSDTGLVYREVKKHLDGGRPVLFSGTPCQVAGLRGFLRGKTYENLFTMDLVCHGVPSTALFNGWQALEEQKHGGAMLSVNFRDKRYGWTVRGTYVLRMKDGKEKSVLFDNYNSSYYYLFLKAGFNRENCYSCCYTGLQRRPGDLSIGDFWGVDKYQPELLRQNGGDWAKDSGISCLLVNTAQGERLLQHFGGGLDCRDSTVEQITAQNKPLLRPSFSKVDRAAYLKLYREGGYVAIDRQFRKAFGKKLFVMGKWDRLPPETRAKIKKIKKILPR